MNNKDITNVKIIKDHLFKRVITRPFKYYGRAGGFTFGLVALTNLLTSIFDPDRRQFLFQYPQIYCMGLVSKSAYFGLLWPSFYITAVKYPKSAFIYGSGLEKAAEELEKASIELEKRIAELEK